MVAKEQFNVYVAVPVAYPDTVLNFGQFNGGSRNCPVGLVEHYPVLTRITPNNYKVARFNTHFIVGDLIWRGVAHY